MPPYVLKWFYWPKFKFRKPYRPNLTFLESQTSSAALIQVSIPQLAINEHLGVLTTGTSYWMNYVLRFHWETLCCKTPPNLTVDGCSSQAQALEFLNGTHMLLLFCLVRSFTAKGIYLKEARSRVWTWITGPFRDLNLKFRWQYCTSSERLYYYITIVQPIHS